MKRFFALLTILIAVAPAGAGLVAAQENATATASSSPTATPENVATVEVDPTLTVTRWKFKDGTFIIHLKASVPKRVAITDHGELVKELSSGKGAKSTKLKPARRYNIAPGKSTLRFSATEYKDMAAVTIGTTGGRALLRTNELATSKPAVEWGTVQVLLAGTFGGTALITYRRVRDKYDDSGKEEADRVF